MQIFNSLGQKVYQQALTGSVQQLALTLIAIEEGAETVTIGLQFDWLADAKLMLTDALIAEMLKQKKASGVFDETQFDEIETSERDEEDAPETVKP